MAGPQVTLNKDWLVLSSCPLCSFAAYNCHSIITNPGHQKAEAPLLAFSVSSQSAVSHAIANVSLPSLPRLD